MAEGFDFGVGFEMSFSMRRSGTGGIVVGGRRRGWDVET